MDRISSTVKAKFTVHRWTFERVAVVYLLANELAVRMASKVIYFSVGGKDEQAEFDDDNTVDDIKGDSNCSANCQQKLFWQLHHLN